MGTFTKRFRHKNVEDVFKCFAECSQCCKNLVLTIPERNMILEYMDANGFSLEKKAQFIHSYEPDYKGTPHLHIAGTCPLLTNDGKCSVYDVRPLNCRTFFCGRANIEEPLEYDKNGTCLNSTRRAKTDSRWRKFLKFHLLKHRKWARKGGWI